MTGRPFSAHAVAPAQWLPRVRAHEERVAAYADPYLKRRSSGRKHPVEDFLFTYYTQKPGQLRRWHPGAGVVLTGAEAAERVGWKYYRTANHSERAAMGVPEGEPAVLFDAAGFAAERSETVDFARIILSGTAARPGHFGCFGLHEWAMVYRQEANSVRHEYLGLRLGAEGTDAVVEANRIRCTHFDAFRFYTPQAVARNELTPTRGNQRDLEQPGCLHANMDLYKWAYKLAPALPSELVMDCFELAWQIRAMDMQASPYDLQEWGYPAIAIETAEGKVEYVVQQRRFNAMTATLRARVLVAVDALPSTGRRPRDNDCASEPPS